MEQKESRTCNRCGETKPIAAFVFNARSGNYLFYCSDCDKKYHQEYYHKLREKNASVAVEIDPNATKICRECREEKPLSEFNFDKGTAKFINTCKSCKAKYTKGYYAEHTEERKDYAKKYREANKDKIDEYQANYRVENAEQRRAYSRQYEKDHPDEVRARRKAYRQAHKEEFRERDRQYAETHKEQIAKRYKEWAKANAERISQYGKEYRAKNAPRIAAKRREYDRLRRPQIREYMRNKRNTDPLFKLSTQVRNLINKSLKNRGYGKDTHTYEILGADYETVWEYLKRTWADNYGTEWNGESYHIDHIVPLATATTKKEVQKLCYYKNLQLLKPRDNLVKNKNLDWTLTPETK